MGETSARSKSGKKKIGKRDRKMKKKKSKCSVFNFMDVDDECTCGLLN